jgi:TonB family protein
VSALSKTRARRPSFGLAIGVSILAHVGLIALYVWAGSARPAIDLDKTLIRVHMAKLGKKRDEKLLPRFDASESQAPEVKVKAPAKKEEPKHEAVATKSKPKDAKPSNPLDLLKKRFGKPSDEGSEKGSALGKSLNDEFANNYEAQIVELIRAAYELPSVLEGKQLVLWVKLKIGPRGDLIKVSITKSSGRQAFDNAVLVGVKKIRSFGAPPLQLRQRYASEGVDIEFFP